MTWTLKLRGDPTGLIVLEYMCPLHGRFEAGVPRRDTPDSVRCLHREADICGLESPWSPSSVTSRVKPGEVIRGKVETAGLPADVCMSTRELADGMPLAEFKAKRAKLHADLAVKKMRQLTGRTGKVWSR